MLQVLQRYTLAVDEHVVGAVKSDTDYQPDAHDLNHCRNTIELANGRRITVIDTHQMMRSGCSSPGERISLTGMGASWILGTLSGG